MIKKIANRTRSISVSLLICGALLTTACGSNSSTAISAPPMGGGDGIATLSWDAPTLNEDGSALIDLAGYKIYRGSLADPSSHALVAELNSGFAAYVVENLGAGTHYFSITAVNSLSVESDFSNVAQISVN